MLDEINRGFTFADAGFPHQQNAFAVDFHQHAVACDSGGQVTAQGDVYKRQV